MRIAVVEDCDTDFRLLKTALTSYDVVRFKTLKEYTQFKKKLDMCIADLSLPDSWGVDTIKAVSKKGVPFVILSGIASGYFPHKVIELVLKSGGLAMIDKRDTIGIEWDKLIKEVAV